MRKRLQKKRGKPSDPVLTDEALLSFVKDREGYLSLILEVQEIDMGLSSAHQCIQELLPGSPEEDGCLSEIRALEDRRFQLLSLLLGNRVNDYHLLSDSPKAS